MDIPEPTIVSSAQTLSGETSGNFTISDGGTLTISGTHDGTVELEGGGTALLTGTLDGTLEVGSLANAHVTGDVVGAVIVRVAGTVVVATSGRVAGPITNHGSFTNHGMRSGPVEGREPDDQPGSEVAEPQHPGVYNLTLPPR